MPFEIPFATMLEFSSRGTNETAQLSKRICGNIKSGNSRVIDRLIYYMSALPENHPISQMFRDNPVLVPAPRNTPMVDEALWPSRILSEHLVKSGFGAVVQNLVARETPVPKSSNFYTADSRPSCDTHYNSLVCTPPQAFIEKIILVDDVFTLGRTSCACVRKLKETYPNAEIFVFAAMRTRGLVKSIEEIVRPSYSHMIYYSEQDTIILPD